MSGPRTILIDGDITIYQCAASVEKAVKWDDDLWTLHASEGEGIKKLVNHMETLVERLKADDVVVALSDRQNFRYDVYPEYKSNRKDVRKPLILKPLREYVEANWRCFSRPRLEGDDVLGILATSDAIIKGEKVVVSIDKDLRTIPGLIYRTDRNKDGIVEVTEEEADHWHLVQSLAGDPTDGYPGCPGIGIDRAEKALTPDEDGLTYKLVPVDHVPNRGKNAGKTTTKWVPEPCDDLWEIIVSHYAAKGLGEEFALTQARCARILRNTDYDFKRKEPILWTPH